ncbi:hypothetical protein ACMG4M_05370 [Alcanivorax sp. IL3]|uniref:hypothetical protein n=1 Tax=unclassified Alcanivorax TaxID=2638842 RepID=UPI0039C304EE
MTTYNTGNPVPSADARDLYDNAENLDAAVNSSNAEWEDRTGTVRPTLKKLEEDYPNAAADADRAEAAEAAAAGHESAAEGYASDAQGYANTAATNADIYDDTAAGLAGTAEGEQFQVESADGLEFIRYLHDTGGVATEVGRFPSSEGVADARNTANTALDRVWKLEKRLDGDWWTKIATPPLALYDLSYGAGEGYTVSGSDVTAIRDLSGNGDDLVSEITNRPVGSVGGHPGITFDGSEPYSGENDAISALISTPLDSFSLHEVSKITDVSQSQTVLGMQTAADPDSLDPSIRLNHNSSGTHSASVFQGGSAILDMGSGPVYTYSDNDVLIRTSYYSGADQVSYCFLNGWINNYREGAAPETYTDFNLGHVTVGNYRQGQGAGGLLGDFGAAAAFSGPAHTVEEAAAAHKAMMERWAPSEMQDTFAVHGYGQSNLGAAYTNASPVTFADGEAYQHSISNDELTRGAITQGTDNQSPVWWFAKEISNITGKVPVIMVRAAGGIGLVGGGYNGDSAYLEPETEAAINAGAPGSGYTSNIDLYKRWAKLNDLTPRFRTQDYRILFWVGCETDVSNINSLKVGGVVPEEVLLDQQQQVAAALDNLITRCKIDLGYTHFALCLTGRRGETLAAVEENMPAVNAVNAAYRQVAASRDDVHIVYEHTTNYDPDNFSQDDLVVDGDGAWVSGHGTRDGTHYTEAAFKAIGVTGARNFLRQIGEYN